MNTMTQEKKLNETKVENRVSGTVGAFLFALVGGAIYFALWQVGYIASISGLIAVVCAFKGYELFAKKESTYGIVISVVMAVLVIAIAWYLCLSQDLYQAYQEWYEAGEVDFTITFGGAVRNAYRFLAEPEIARSYFGSLAIGIGLCALGCISPIRAAIQRTKGTANTQPQAEPDDMTANDSSASEALNGETTEQDNRE